MITEDYLKFTALLFPQVRTVGGIRPRGAPERCRQHAVVRGGPFKAGVGGDLEYFIGDRPFRGPQSHGRYAEDAPDIIARHLELNARILRIPETARQRDVRV